MAAIDFLRRAGRKHNECSTVSTVAAGIGCSRTASLAPMVAIHRYWNRDWVDHHIESPALSINDGFSTTLSHLLESGAIPRGEDGFCRFLFEWISRAYVTIDPARPALCLRLA
jgi:hypothetical protein